MINVYRTLLLLLLSILYFLGVEVSKVLFEVGQGWKTNHGINYQLINSQGVTAQKRTFFSFASLALCLDQH
jgi:hypothetical protein